MKKFIIASLIAALTSTCLAQSLPPSKIAIAIHGGAGNILAKNLTTKQQQQYQEKLTEAVDAGYKILNQGGSSLDAINAAINLLENSPLFNAGLGAVYTFDGSHQLDASIMDGKTKQAGAVAGVSHIANPIDLARLVMTESVHVMLSGEGAAQFALKHGMPWVKNDYFDTDKRYQSLLKAKQKLKALDAKSKNNAEYQANYRQIKLDYKFGTVGAVAVDRAGNVAAGTSTGGMTAKRFGRIGDSPIIGAGTWADNQSCAVSATGHGEYFIRYHVAADICAQVQYQGKTIKQASQDVIFGSMKQAGGTGGVIVVDPKGNIALTFNTSGMYRGWRVEGEKTHVAMFKE